MQRRRRNESGVLRYRGNYQKQPNKRSMPSKRLSVTTCFAGQSGSTRAALNANFAFDAHWSAKLTQTWYAVSAHGHTGGSIRRLSLCRAQEFGQLYGHLNRIDSWTATKHFIKAQAKLWLRFLVKKVIIFPCRTNAKQ